MPNINDIVTYNATANGSPTPPVTWGSWTVTPGTQGTDYNIISGGGTNNTIEIQWLTVNNYTVGVTADNCGPAVPGSIPVSVTNGGCTDLAPSNLQVITNANTLANITWTDNSANELGFRVEYSTDNNNWFLYSIENTNTTFCNNSNQGVVLNNNTEYWFRVQNIGTCNSNWSNVGSVLTAPQIPQNFTTTATASVYQMNLNWDNNNPNLGLYPVTYKVEASKLNPVCSGGLKLVTNTSSDNYLITNLIAGNSNSPQAYTYRVTAININGVESNFVQNSSVVGAIASGTSSPNSCLNNDINLFAADPCVDCAFWS